MPLRQSILKSNEFQSSYSKEAAALSADVKAKVTNGLDASFRARYKAWEMCAVAIPPLSAYNNLLTGQMNQPKFAAARVLLINLFSNGVQKMSEAQKELDDSSASFEEAANNQLSLDTRFESDFSEGSEYYKTQISNIMNTVSGVGFPFFLFGILIPHGGSEAKLVPEVKAKMAAIQKSNQELTSEVQKTSKNIDSTKSK